MTFKVIAADKGYEVQDESGNVYGRYNKKEEAEQVARDWSEYYKAPLVF